jgi:hypothetical protein
VNNSPVYIGCSNPPGGEFFKGSIDEVSIYGRALSAPEVAAIYTAGSAGKCAPLTAPSIYAQPLTQQLFEGQTATFSVSATGTAPLFYQWSFNGTNIVGATDSQLILTNLQISQAGAYSVGITNSVGIALSTSAQLTVYPLLSGCVVPPNGIVAWWPGEGAANDVIGTNYGLFQTPQFAPGEVQRAFNFDGSGNNIRVPASPALDIGQSAGMTVEAWINPSDTSGRPIVEWAPGMASGGYGVHFYAGANGPGILYANIIGTDGAGHVLQSAGGVVTNNGFQHVALTYDKSSGAGRLYLNGLIVATGAFGNFTPQTSADLYIGYRPNTIPFGPIAFKGEIDEVSLYSRALANTEIQAIVTAGAGGKCLAPMPPQIDAEPPTQTVVAGQSAVFTANAAGTTPLSYQWSFEGTNIAGATTSSLVLTNVQLGQSGVYAVEVTNLYGSAVSSNLNLTVVSAPSCAPRPAGLVSWWTAEGNAFDAVGSNDAAYTNNVSFAPGLKGLAFNFDGATTAITVPPSPSLGLSNLTIETWIFPTDSGTPRPIFEYANSTGGYALGFWYNIGAGGQPSPGALFGFARDAVNPNNNFYLASTGGLLPTNRWSHVAFAFDSSGMRAVLYVNGVVVATNNFGIPVHPDTQLAVNLGYRPVGSSDVYAGVRLKGELDEVSLYSRALASTEIQAIVTAGAAGKCLGPIPPQIDAEPPTQTIMAGQAAVFTAYAAGTRPLSYQWSFEGTNIAGATTSSLVLTNVQPGQAGVYSVEVTNLYGSAVFSNLNLTVVSAPPCDTLPAGLVSWWPGNGDATDATGGQNGIFTNPQFSAGEVGSAFKFDGTGNNIRIPAAPSLDLGKSAGFSIEAWINPVDVTKANPIVEWMPASAGSYGVHFYAGGAAELYADVYGGGDHVIQTAAGILTNVGFQHAVLTYDKASGVAQLFLNGAVMAHTTLGTFIPQTSQDLHIGYRPSSVPFGPYAFNGLIDEVSLYSRALTSGEVQALYGAGSSGKCPALIPPSFFAQPSDETVTRGQVATFSVDALGAAPIVYQWAFNGTNISGGTNAYLSLTNVQMNQAGSYSVTATNAYGTATSSNATLVVKFPAANVNVLSASGTAGQVVTVPVVLAANGNENAVGFSLNFSPTQLTNVGVTLGTGATGGALQFNSGAPGTVGIAVALPSGSTFAPGTQEVAKVSFVSAVSATPYSAHLTFGDQPTTRQLSDARANPLAANFTGNDVTLNRAFFEGDLAPLPNGDGTVSVIDWVQVGRYVAALDSPANASQFQRADCAPRSSGGDGLLTVSDWVQAGRFAAGLDPLTVASGPTVPAGGNLVGPARKDGSTNSRIVTLSGPLMFQGQTASALINLEAQGDENAVGLSLSFDPKVVNYTGALLGADATSATMDVNANQAASGSLGIILALPTGSAFIPGARQLVKVSFQAMTSNSVDSAVSLADLPVRREVADTNALPVAATYANGTISVNPTPSLVVSKGNAAINLSWPLWATNYSLQQALGTTWLATGWTNLTVSPAITNNALGVKLPFGGSVQFYRLKHQ